MIAPWVAPRNQLYLVAYDLARKLAQHFDGEVIETAVDRHADLAADIELISDEPE